MSPARLHEEPFTARPPREATAPAVPRLPGIEATIERIERRVARARRDHAALSLVAVSLGPVTTGDGGAAPERAPALAVEFGHRLRARIRGTDDLWQSAEAEWIALLPHCRAEGARAAARRLAFALGAPYALADGLLLTQARVGVATLRDPSDTGAGLLVIAQASQGFEEVRTTELRAG